MNEVNLKSSTIEAGIELIKDFLNRSIGPTIDELGPWASEPIKMWRFKNQVKNLNRAKEICIENNVAIKRINMKALFPYLEGVAAEENPELQEMWANLFVNYIDSNKNLTLTVYPDTLKHLSSHEAEILKRMINDENYSIATDEFKQVTYPVGYEEIANLVRLGLIEAHRTIEYINDPSVKGNKRPMERNTENDLYFLTQFGHHFLEACSREQINH